MFQVGDKIVHPMHGAGIVESIVQKKVNGVMRDYYVLKLPVRAMVVMIPTDNSEEIGVRPIVDREQADQVLAAIPGIEVDMTQNWNRRYRENLERLKSGNLLEVARVVKGLMLRELERGLSTARLREYLEAELTPEKAAAEPSDKRFDRKRGKKSPEGEDTNEV